MDMDFDIPELSVSTNGEGFSISRTGDSNLMCLEIDASKLGTHEVVEGFHSHGGTPIAGCFLIGKVP